MAGSKDHIEVLKQVKEMNKSNSSYEHKKGVNPEVSALGMDRVYKSAFGLKQPIIQVYTSLSNKGKDLLAEQIEKRQNTEQTTQRENLETLIGKPFQKTEESQIQDGPKITPKEEDRTYGTHSNNQITNKPNKYLRNTLIGAGLLGLGVISYLGAPELGYYNTYGQTSPEFQELLNTGNLPQYVIDVHTIKKK